MLVSIENVSNRRQLSHLPAVSDGAVRLFAVGPQGAEPPTVFYEEVDRAFESVMGSVEQLSLYFCDAQSGRKDPALAAWRRIEPAIIDGVPSQIASYALPDERRFCAVRIDLSGDFAQRLVGTLDDRAYTARRAVWGALDYADRRLSDDAPRGATLTIDGRAWGTAQPDVRSATRDLGWHGRFDQRGLEERATPVVADAARAAVAMLEAGMPCSLAIHGTARGEIIPRNANAWLRPDHSEPDLHGPASNLERLGKGMNHTQSAILQGGDRSGVKAEERSMDIAASRNATGAFPRVFRSGQSIYSINESSDPIGESVGGFGLGFGGRVVMVSGVDANGRAWSTITNNLSHRADWNGLDQYVEGTIQGEPTTMSVESATSQLQLTPEQVRTLPARDGIVLASFGSWGADGSGRRVVSWDEPAARAFDDWRLKRKIVKVGGREDAVDRADSVRISGDDCVVVHASRSSMIVRVGGEAAARTDGDYVAIRLTDADWKRHSDTLAAIIDLDDSDHAMVKIAYDARNGGLAAIETIGREPRTPWTVGDDRRRAAVSEAMLSQPTLAPDVAMKAIAQPLALIPPRGGDDRPADRNRGMALWEAIRIEDRMLQNRNDREYKDNDRRTIDSALVAWAARDDDGVEIFPLCPSGMGSRSSSDAIHATRTMVVGTYRERRGIPCVEIAGGPEPRLYHIGDGTGAASIGDPVFVASLGRRALISDPEGDVRVVIDASTAVVRIDPSRAEKLIEMVHEKDGKTFSRSSDGDVRAALNEAARISPDGAATVRDRRQRGRSNFGIVER